MAIEPFLINPPRHLSRLSRRLRLHRLNRFNDNLFSNAPARKPKKRRKTVAKRKASTKGRKRHRPVLYSAGPKKWARGPKSKSRLAGISINPARRRRRRNSPLMIAGANPPSRRRRNAPVRRKYSMRRNPQQAITLGGPMEFQKNLPYMFTGATAAISVAMVPGMVSPMLGPVAAGPGGRILLEFGTAILGGFVVNMVQPRKGHAAVFTLVGSGIALADAIKEYVLKPMGFVSDYEVSDYEVSEDPYDYTNSISAFPDTGMGAFPNTEENY